MHQLIRVANDTSKILALTNFSSYLEISTAFAKSLEVLFILLYFHVNKCFGLCLGFTNMDLTISASLGFYHLTPLLLPVSIKFLDDNLIVLRKKSHYSSFPGNVFFYTLTL